MNHDARAKIIQGLTIRGATTLVGVLLAMAQCQTRLTMVSARDKFHELIIQDANPYRMPYGEHSRWRNRTESEGVRFHHNEISRGRDIRPHARSLCLSTGQCTVARLPALSIQAIFIASNLGSTKRTRSCSCCVEAMRYYTW